MKKKLLFIHGRGPQPDADGLRKLLLQAIKIGVGREAPKQLAQLDNLQTELFYFADRNQQQIDRANTQHLRQQQEVLALLAEREKRRDFRRRHYDELPGKSALGEFAMDLAASAGLGGMAMRKVAPALEQYWHDDNFANTLNLDLQSWLLENVRSADKILLVSHCVGSVFVYDCLAQSQLQLGTWITLGSPLANQSVRRKLKKDFTSKVDSWLNFSAEDDVMCHDKTMADDFAYLVKDESILSIVDHTIYNLAQIEERSEPSHWAGYVVHPLVIDQIVNWLAD